MTGKIISVREHPAYLNRAVDYFSSKWGIDRKLYEAAVSDGITTANPLPRWFLLLKDGEIIGSYGLIENDVSGAAGREYMLFPKKARIIRRERRPDDPFNLQE
ncbi:hypothetical protein Sgly_0952 [Syntrophobotulus glycolicus DSM 8271]|uniref:GCN5-related N-acetyltransferase n=1 Tax=Syntrophobotulus glycolicus (strain DSM 8271 / FlGlyR) TaxID=645991 RepID=F0T2H6_SYNGF|nr:hypothetical protein [Syntrophobotulus glycolicus]ADY55294.1 hypothetical protein Sgly_0952 [Syntrophobotulus glycolicus DSM 8271]